MNKKNSYIAAAALAISGIAGMAGWLALEADELGPASAMSATANTQSGVSETEAALAPAAAPVATPALIEPEVAVAAIGGVVPAVRTSRTPIAVPNEEPARREARAVEPANPVNPEPRTAEPANRERTEPVEPREPANRRTEPVAPAEPVEPREPVVLVVPTNAVLGLRLATDLTSDTAEVEDRVEATLTRDVIADGRVAIPAGTKVLGSVNEVTRGGKFKERARLSVRFHTLVLADGTHEKVRVDSVVREGESPTRASAAKIGGGAVGGAIIGGIMGGRKGAILGGAAGAGAGTAAVVSGDRSVATLTAGTPLSVRLDAPVTIKREQ